MSPYVSPWAKGLPDNRNKQKKNRTPTPSPSLSCALGLPPKGGSIHPLTGDAVPAVTAVVLVLDDAVPPQALVAAATGVARSLLVVPGLLLAVNLSLRLSGSVRSSGRPLDDAWTLIHANLNVLQDAGGAAVPLLTEAVAFTTAHTTLAWRQQFTTVILSTPSTRHSPPRWLPASLSPFRVVMLAITLVWRCPEDPSITTSVVVQVPCPGDAQPLAAEVKAAGTAAQYSALLAGPALGGAVGRMAAERSLVLCSGGTVAEGLMPLSVPACSDTRDGLTMAARGAVLGNLALWAAACLLMAAVAVAYARLVSVQIRCSVVALGLPSPLLPLLTATVPSTASATFHLLQRRACAVDAAIAALGVAMCVVPIAAMSLLAFAVPRLLRLVPAQVPSAVPVCAPQGLRSLLSLVFRRRVRWCDVANGDPCGGAAEPSGWLRRCATVVLLDYAAVWYACVDVVVLTAACLLGAVSALGSAGACRGSAIAVLLLDGGLLALCAAARPFTTMFSHVHALTSLVLSTTAVACQVWYLYGVSEDNVDADALRRLLTVVAVCDLLVAGISVAKAVVDMADALRACRRHAMVLRVARCRDAAGALHPAAPASTLMRQTDVSMTALKRC
jgi:hypothetical protein